MGVLDTRYYKRVEGGGGGGERVLSASGPIRKAGWGVLSALGPIRKAGGGGGGGVLYTSGTIRKGQFYDLLNSARALYN